MPWTVMVADFSAALEKFDFSTVKADGKETMRVTEAISNGGKLWTRTVKGKDEQGKDFENVLVFEKQ